MPISDSVCDVVGGFIAKTSTKVGSWRERFEHHLIFENQQITPLLSSPAQFLPPPTYAVPCDPPSETQITDAIRGIRNNKAPGEDGVPDEICRYNVNTLAPWLHEESQTEEMPVNSECDCYLLVMAEESQATAIGESNQHRHRRKTLS
ncbi:hypothetical protein SprV_1002906200 [Sparganum proliferum]